MWIFLNDRFVDRKEAVVSVFDHGFLYGDGVYETLRAYGGRIFMLPRHLARLERSAQLIGLAPPLAEKDWGPLLAEAMRRNGIADAYLRITISRGEGEIGLDPALCPRPTLVVIAKPYVPYPARLFEEGVDLAIVAVRRNLPAALPPEVKSLNFLNNILAKREAIAARAFEGLLLTARGELAEGTTSNLFFVRDGRLCTPAAEGDILGGITREVVLLLAREAGLPTEEGRYTPEALRAAEECFLTNTTMEIMPVARVDGAPVGAGRPGPLTRRLRDLFRTNLPRFLFDPRA
jgi:branched-chain amino acid aminotransferase